MRPNLPTTGSHIVHFQQTDQGMVLLSSWLSAARMDFVLGVHTPPVINPKPHTPTFYLLNTHAHQWVSQPILNR